MNATKWDFNSWDPGRGDFPSEEVKNIRINRGVKGLFVEGEIVDQVVFTGSQIRFFVKDTNPKHRGWNKRRYDVNKDPGKDGSENLRKMYNLWNAIVEDGKPRFLIDEGSRRR